MSRLRPLGDRVIVLPSNDTPEKVGSIYIPTIAQEKPQHGEVVAVGPGTYEQGAFVAMDVYPSQKVLYGKYSGTEVQIEGTTHLMLRRADILAVIEED